MTKCCTDNHTLHHIGFYQTVDYRIIPNYQCSVCKKYYQCWGNTVKEILHYVKKKEIVLPPKREHINARYEKQQKTIRRDGRNKLYKKRR